MINTGLASPYLATKIKELTTDPATGEVNKATNAMAHAVLGAVVAELNNQSAVAGGLGAGGGELSAHVILNYHRPAAEFVPQLVPLTSYSLWLFLPVVLSQPLTHPDLFVILNTLFPGKKVSDLSEKEKQQVSALSQLASGL